jgi:hypothetical protein
MAMSDPRPPGNPPKNATRVWAEGYAARLSGFERQDNPYLDGEDFREEIWDDGWLHADGEIARGRLPGQP